MALILVLGFRRPPRLSKVENSAKNCKNTFRKCDFSLAGAVVSSFELPAVKSKVRQGLHERPCGPQCDRTAHRLERRRRSCAREACPSGLSGTAPYSAPLHGSRTVGTHSSNHRIEDRSLYAPGGSPGHELAEPESLLRDLCQLNAAGADRFCPLPS